MRKVLIANIVFFIALNVLLTGCTQNVRKEATGTAENVGKGARKTEEGAKETVKVTKESTQSVKQGYQQESGDTKEEKKASK